MCSVLPLPLDPREDTSAARFRFRETKTSISTSLLETSNGITELPKSWDARVDHPRSPQCKELINKVHNQGTCGSCYAFAALGTASIRACMAGHEVKNNWYSVQDVLNCGSDREGSFQNRVIEGATGTTFAGNCGKLLSAVCVFVYRDNHLTFYSFFSSDEQPINYFFPVLYFIQTDIGQLMSLNMLLNTVSSIHIVKNMHTVVIH